MAINVKGYFINVNSENVEYGWVYMALDVKEDSVYVLEGLINDLEYDIPKSDLKEISFDEYCKLARIVEDVMYDVWGWFSDDSIKYDKVTVSSKTLKALGV